MKHKKLDVFPQHLRDANRIEDHRSKSISDRAPSNPYRGLTLVTCKGEMLDRVTRVTL